MLQSLFEINYLRPSTNFDLGTTAKGNGNRQFVYLKSIRTDVCMYVHMYLCMTVSGKTIVPTSTGSYSRHSLIIYKTGS